ncbi:hypothetical protein CKN99_05245 [Carnobacterium maltaromaticum]|nr:hypothetical protein BFC23_02005 [Carnobacterium maltaromaticum]MBC9788785.1 hypothetical protein [Carnobacterium maltaromaticum]MBC9808332.1 hypothetical protein [Carnobacterium maltaromaticum]MCC4313184.1 hypothetical protein [Carnobacterium maltaromaticum]TFJ29433.1 hypothetical protein CKN90_05240 [Carnobacterium maltaromaticum]
MAFDEHEEDRIVASIGKHFDKLDGTLEKLDDTDSKVKGYIEQKKAIHEVKKILHKAGKLEKYTEDELNTPI